MTFRCGDIVLVPFPFTDLSTYKRRPALLLQSLGEFGDWLCLPVTTQAAHLNSQELREQDFSDDKLPHTSWVRLNRPTLLSDSIMLGRLATLKPDVVEGVRYTMCKAIGCGGSTVMEPQVQPYQI